MTRGHPPYVAIGEAMRRAAAWGRLVLAPEPAGDIPFHFITIADGRMSLGRVRRLKLPGYTVPEIEHSCRNEIAELRTVTVTEEILRELWVRGPDRHWYRYLIFPDCVMELEDGIRETDGKEKPQEARRDDRTGITPERTAESPEITKPTMNTGIPANGMIG